MDPTNLLNDISAFLSYMQSNGQHMLPFQNMMHMLPPMASMPPMPPMQPWVSQSLSNLVPEPPMLYCNENKEDAKALPRKRSRSRSRSRSRTRDSKRARHHDRSKKIIDALYDEFKNMPDILECFKNQKVINKLTSVSRYIAFSAIRQAGFRCRKFKIVENPMTMMIKQVNMESMRGRIISAKDYIHKCMYKGCTDLELRNRILGKIYCLIDETKSRPIDDTILEDVKRAPLPVLFATIDTVSLGRATIDINDVLVILMQCAQRTYGTFNI